MKKLQGSAATAAMLLCAVFAGSTHASDGTEAPVANSTTLVFGPARAVDPHRLDRQRGGLDTSNSNALQGNVRDNSATNVVTGSNTVADGSFAHAAGLPTVIQNTGANVLIQNATIVNVQLK